MVIRHITQIWLLQIITFLDPWNIIYEEKESGPIFFLFFFLPQKGKEFSKNEVYKWKWKKARCYEEDKYVISFVKTSSEYYWRLTYGTKHDRTWFPTSKYFLIWLLWWPHHLD